MAGFDEEEPDPDLPGDTYEYLSEKDICMRLAQIFELIQFYTEVNEEIALHGGKGTASKLFQQSTECLQ